MPSACRAFDRGTRLGRRHLRDVADEYRERRLALGLSQVIVAEAAHLSRSRYSRIESAKVETLTVVEVARIANILGLNSSVRLFPGGTPIRDAGHSGRLTVLLEAVRSPLTFKVEEPLPASAGRWEQRAWDAMLHGHGERTAIELEMRLRDLQALQRRIALKRRDDAVEHFLLVIADTAANRRVLDELAEPLLGLTRLRRAGVLSAVAAGRHPETGLILI